MGKKAEEEQKAAHDAHLRGKAALDKGDLKEAMDRDDEARFRAIQAMLLRMKGK